MKKIYKVQLSQYVREYTEIYVEATSIDDAALTAIEASNWIVLEWKLDNEACPKWGTPIVIGPTLEEIPDEKIYRRKG